VVCAFPVCDSFEPLVVGVVDCSVSGMFLYLVGCGGWGGEVGGDCE
jgi:hypothetical protein